ncbi:retention module-containing protein [Comamonas endophytica]|uniref:retention module-containing protein n=1 Tax=Comamonas endophytica TaxID=2949090 RepID=UPI00360E9B9D
MAAAQTVLVTQLTGQAWIRGTDGSLTPIHEGMRIPADAVIVTSSGGSVQLQADGQPPLIVGENQELVLTADLVNPPLPQEAAVAAPVPAEIDQIIAAINAGQDPFEQLDPTAATLGGGSEGGSTFVRLARILESTSPLALAFDTPTATATEVPLFSGAAEVQDDGQDAAQPAPAPATPQANADAGSVLEDAAQPLLGNVLANDTLGAGTLAEHQVALAGNGRGQYGQITLNADGSYSYQLDNSLPSVQSLAAGETATESFTYTLVDANGVSSSGSLTVTIVGTNDAPVLSGQVAIVVSEDQATPVTGQLTVTDVDASDTHIWTVANGGQGQYGNFTVDQTGRWTYVPGAGNADVQGLTAGQQLTDTITVTVSDGQGGTATQTVTVTIEGADDGAVVVPATPGSDLGSVTEDGTLTTRGKLNVTDPDAGQAVFVAQNVATTYGQFIIGTDGTWTYTLNNDNPAVQALGAGQTLTETHEVRTADGTTANVVITINGTNDVPTLGTGVASVTEDVAVSNGQLVTSGSVTITDIDAGQSSFQPAAVFNGTDTALGTLVFNTDGSYSYSVDNSKVQYLKTGESVVETYTVTSIDGSASTTISITINGADDGAVIVPATPGSDLGSVTEDGTLTTSGKLNVTDPDAGQSVFVAQNVATTYGQFIIGTDGTWTYTLNNDNPAVQALGAGQTLTETHEVRTADGTTANVAITINGTNDVPTLGTGVASVIEDVAVSNGQLVTSGVVSISDIDGGQNSFQPTAVFNGTGSALGTLVFNTDGTYSYSVDNSKVQYLKTGESVVETYTVTSIDGSASTTISITINGADDGAVIVPGVPGGDVGSVTEDGALSTSGKLNVTEPDAGQAVFVAQNVTTTYGQFTISTDGAWTYQLNNDNPAVQALGAGQTLTETREVRTADGTTANVVITINGTNDVPTLGTGVASVTEDVAVANGQLVASGVVSISDIDGGQNSFQPAAVFNGTGTALGTLVFNTDGTYSYSVDNSKVQYLKTGESVVETYTVTSIDGSASTTISITINGADDGAVIVPATPGSDLGSVTEDSTLTTSGKLNVVDPDAGQAVFVAQNVATTYGQFIIGTGGTWTYTLNNDNPAVQALGAGQTLTETHEVRTADGTTANVVITINGTNDVPTLGTGVASVTEDVAVSNGQLVTSGVVSISDIDGGQNSFQPTAVFNGTGSALGTLVFNTDGTYSYSVDNSKVQYLKTGESVVETYTVTSIDGSASTTISITINGADDGAVIVPGVPGGDVGSVTEDGALSTSGKLNVTEPDAGQAVFVAQNVTTTYGQFTISTDGAWTYQLNNDNPAVQALGAGQTLTETREVRTADGTTANVVITINGTNDVPTLGTGVASVTEDVAVANGQLVASGVVSISDIDGGQNSFQPAAVFNGTGTALGTLVFNTDGTYSYSVDNSKVQYLKTGESVVETYTVTSIDGSASTTISITINGADDGAVIVPATPGSDLGSVTEDGTLTTSGKLNVTDPDAGQAVFVVQNVATTYGQFTIGTDGTWTYTLNNDNPAVQALGAGQTLTETREVRTADGTTANVVITINGTNDVPTLGTGVASVTEDVAVSNGQLVTSGSVTITDIDAGQNSFQAAAVFNGTGTALGTLVFNTDGSYSYSVDNSKVQYLKTGESVVETYTVTSIDGSASTTISITINGADDGAVIVPATPGSDLGSVTEDSTLTTSGKLNVVDPDAGQAVFVAQNVATTYGRFTIGTDGTWTYTLNNDNPAVQALGAGQTLTETHEVRTADGTTANVVITINGTNDVPTLGTGVASVAEDVAVSNGQLVTSGVVSISDIDAGENSFQPAAVFNGTGTALGTLVFNTDGSYSYSVDNSKVQYLKTGQSVVETYTVTSVDGSATTTIAITINGADDGAVIVPATLVPTVAR